MNDCRVDAGHVAGAVRESNETAIVNEKLALQSVGFLLAPWRQVSVAQLVAEHQAKLSGFDHCLDDTLRFPLVRLRIRPYRLEGDINHVVGIQASRQVLTICERA